MTTEKSVDCVCETIFGLFLLYSVCVCECVCVVCLFEPRERNVRINGLRMSVQGLTYSTKTFPFSFFHPPVLKHFFELSESK